MGNLNIARRACSVCCQHFDLGFGVDIGIEINFGWGNLSQIFGQIEAAYRVTLPLMDIDRALIEQQRRTGAVDLPDDAAWHLCGWHWRILAIKVNVRLIKRDRYTGRRAIYYLDCHRITTGAAQADVAGRITFATPEEAACLLL